MSKTIIIVRNGIVESCWSTQPVEIEVLDLDGDRREEFKSRLEALQPGKQHRNETADFNQVWP